MKILEIPPPSVVAMVDAIAAWNLRAATEALERVTAEPEAEAQSCVDADGLPTEGAVLRRQLIAERAALQQKETGQ